MKERHVFELNRAGGWAMIIGIGGSMQWWDPSDYEGLLYRGRYVLHRQWWVLGSGVLHEATYL
jgi:hypothetical protein